MSFVKHFRELDVYQNAMALGLTVFELTKHWPSEERFNLTDQVRRSSRSVCTNLAEAWRKRRYGPAFVAKLSDSETEAAETQVSAEIAMRCQYLDEKTFQEIDAGYEKIIGQIVKMAAQPEKGLIKSKQLASPSSKSEAKNRITEISKNQGARAPHSPTPRYPISPTQRDHE